MNELPKVGDRVRAARITEGVVEEFSGNEFFVKADADNVDLDAWVWGERGWTWEILLPDPIDDPVGTVRIDDDVNVDAAAVDFYTKVKSNVWCRAGYATFYSDNHVAKYRILARPEVDA
ncbi:hypothetical protein GCM10012275_28630 [Longimycelium tulufanense]|uniref:Uncharacterized protein n=1 Tax=Longimycelium tulufanense TaxID=907463 RepID=A0A8J3FWT0_9PSEU|nr:hypothetical protein [Longimycelium tulufanense]GGM55802.1 hypothetical protein GCM10012275_28630 [Longimycelium tulufanense]